MKISYLLMLLSFIIFYYVVHALRMAEVDILSSCLIWKCNLSINANHMHEMSFWIFHFQRRMCQAWWFLRKKILCRFVFFSSSSSCCSISLPGQETLPCINILFMWDEYNKRKTWIITISTIQLLPFSLPRYKSLYLY